MDPWLKYYFKLGLTDKLIAQHVLDHFEMDEYGLSAKSVQRARKRLNLLSARQQLDFMRIYTQVRLRFPSLGSKGMVTHVCLHYDLRLPEGWIHAFLKRHEPESVVARRYKCFKRRVYHCAGVMDIIAVDQHDKWKRYGLYFHVGMDPFSGRISWLKVCWTNRKIGIRFWSCIPLTTQSNPGSENNGIANCHTSIRHQLDPSLCGTSQHCWITGNGKNVKPEIIWKDFRAHCIPSFEEIMEQGVQHGWYKIENPIVIEQLIFCWLAIPWMQAEVNRWVFQRNSSQCCADRHKVFPNHIPDLIHAKPECYNVLSFKVNVNHEILDAAEQKWVYSGNPVFQLTPPSFHTHIQAFYEEIGSPIITNDTLWNIYHQLRAKLQNEQVDQNLTMQWAVGYEDGFEEVVDLMEGQQELRLGEQQVPSSRSSSS
ncbi:hypothetical protein C8J56DRAFT_849581 [Mycena floridula]|nr:hypothetical protein C8J56DRAFT_849581 [Mycena floridula]